MKEVLEIASRISTPLALSGLIAGILYLILRQIIAKDIFPPLMKSHSAEIIRLVVKGLFSLALTAMILGFSGYILPIVLPRIQTVLSEGFTKNDGYNFEAYGLSWHVWKGNPSISPNEIQLNGPADIQTNDNYQLATLVVTAKAEKWAPDTSIGFEIWAKDHYSIRVSSGNLIISSSGVDIEQKQILGWSTLRKEVLNFEIRWNQEQIQLFINDKLNITHKSHDIPVRPLKIRLNAAPDDLLTITGVEVKP